MTHLNTITLNISDLKITTACVITITWHLQEDSMANWEDKLFAASCSRTDSSSSSSSSSSDTQQQQGGRQAMHRQQLPADIDELRYILAVVRADLASPMHVVVCAQ
jgi:hypothetical protein